MEKIRVILLFCCFTLLLYSNEIETLLIIKNIEDNIEDRIEEIIFFIKPEINIKEESKEDIFFALEYKKLPFIINKSDIEQKTILELQKVDFYKKHNLNKKKLNGILENSFFYNDNNILKTNFIIFNNHFKNQFNINTTINENIIFDRLYITSLTDFLFSNTILFNYGNNIKYTGNALYFEESFKNNKFYQTAFINYLIDKNFFNTGLNLVFKINFLAFNTLFYYHNSFYYGLGIGFDYKGFIFNLDNFIISDFSNIYKYRFNLYFSYTTNFLSIRIFKLDKNILDWTKNYYPLITESKFIYYENKIQDKNLYTISSICGIEFLFNYKILYMIINSLFFFENFFLDINFNLPVNIDFFNNYSELSVNLTFNRFLFKACIYAYFLKNLNFIYGFKIYFENIKITSNFEMSDGIIFDIKNNNQFLIVVDTIFYFIPFRENNLFFGAKTGINIENNNPSFYYQLETGFKTNF